MLSRFSKADEISSGLWCRPVTQASVGVVLVSLLDVAEWCGISRDELRIPLYPS